MTTPVPRVLAVRRFLVRGVILNEIGWSASRPAEELAG